MSEDTNRRFDVLITGRRGGRADVRHRGGQARTPRSCCWSTPSGRQENPHLRRRPLQLYQPALQGRTISSPTIRISPNRRWPGILRRIFWRWSRSTALRGTRRSSGSFSAIALRATLSNMLLVEAAEVGVTLLCDTQIIEVRRDDGFHVRSESGEFRAPALIVATGGLSIPKMGATGFGYEIARQFGIRIVEPRPALVPFVLAPEDQQRLCDLSGVSTAVIASIGSQRFVENLLITHRGFSGPAILQISSYWRPGEAVQLDFAPQQRLAAVLDSSSSRRDISALRSHLRTILPQRLADRILEIEPPAAWSNPALEEWERSWHNWRIIPETTEGYAKAEATAGGVDTAELSAKTMESRVRGLFFIGEVVDVTGHLGGFNFQWAWASGAAAGRAV